MGMRKPRRTPSSTAKAETSLGGLGTSGRMRAQADGRIRKPAATVSTGGPHPPLRDTFSPAGEGVTERFNAAGRSTRRLIPDTLAWPRPLSDLRPWRGSPWRHR